LGRGPNASIFQPLIHSTVPGTSPLMASRAASRIAATGASCADTQASMSLSGMAQPSMVEAGPVGVLGQTSGELVELGDLPPQVGDQQVGEVA